MPTTTLADLNAELAKLPGARPLDCLILAPPLPDHCTMLACHALNMLRGVHMRKGRDGTAFRAEPGSRRARPCKFEYVRNELIHASHYLCHLGQRHILETDKTHLNTYLQMRDGNLALARFERLLLPEHERPIVGRSRTTVEAAVYRFLLDTTSRDDADRLVVVSEARSLDAQRPLRWVRWSHLGSVKQVLTPDELIQWVLLTGTGLPNRRLVQIEVSMLHGDGEMGYVEMPPLPGEQHPHTIPAHHDGQVLTAFRQYIQHVDPERRFVFEMRSRDGSRAPLPPRAIASRVRTWFSRLNPPPPVPTPKDIQQSYLGYLLRRKDVDLLDFVRHITMAAGARGALMLRHRASLVPPPEPWGTQQETPALPGFRPCPACGEKFNTTALPRCGRCGTPYGNPNGSGIDALDAGLRNLLQALRSLDRPEAAA